MANTTNLYGEEDPVETTHAIGEEDTTSDMTGEEEASTDAVGEEDVSTTDAVGEEDPYDSTSSTVNPFGAF